MTQYTAGSFAQPIRRVFGTIIFLAREEVTLPPPGNVQAARFKVRMRDLIWETLYHPIAGVVNRAADLFNRYEFLTIRQYLGLVFLLLVLLLLVLAIWP